MSFLVTFFTLGLVPHLVVPLLVPEQIFNSTECYDTDRFCMGVKGREASFGPFRGCIGQHDCMVEVFARRNAEMVTKSTIDWGILILKNWGKVKINIELYQQKQMKDFWMIEEDESGCPKLGHSLNEVTKNVYHPCYHRTHYFLRYQTSDVPRGNDLQLSLQATDLDRHRIVGFASTNPCYLFGGKNAHNLCHEDFLPFESKTTIPVAAMTSSKELKKEKSQKVAIGVIIAAILLLVLMLIIIYVIFELQRRKRKEKKESEDRKMDFATKSSSATQGKSSFKSVKSSKGTSTKASEIESPPLPGLKV